MEAELAVVVGIRRGRTASTLGVRTEEVKQMGRDNKIYAQSKLHGNARVSVGITLDHAIPREAEWSSNYLNKQ